MICQSPTLVGHVLRQWDPSFNGLTVIYDIKPRVVDFLRSKQGPRILGLAGWLLPIRSRCGTIWVNQSGAPMSHCHYMNRPVSVNRPRRAVPADCATNVGQFVHCGDQ